LILSLKRLQNKVLSFEKFIFNQRDYDLRSLETTIIKYNLFLIYYNLEICAIDGGRGRDSFR
jgi:hypothetical protein